MGDGWKSIGGVDYNSYFTQSADKLVNGRYRIVLKTGEKIVFNDQTGKNAKICVTRERGWFSATRCKRYQAVTLVNMDNVDFKGTKETDCHLSIVRSKNVNVDVSRNQKEDVVFLRASDNVTVKTDDNDRLRGSIKTEGRDLIDFRGGEKAGTYKLTSPDAYIKREDVPDALLKSYDDIAKQNNNGIIDTNNEVFAFNDKVHKAFYSGYVSKIETKKMGYESHSSYKYDKCAEACCEVTAGGVIKGFELFDKKVLGGKNTTGSNVLDFCLGATGFTAYMIGVIGGGIVGMVGDAVRVSYDYARGNVDKQTSFTHWKTSGGTCNIEPKKDIK